MIGWAFAVALLVLVLAFEAVLFRHVAADYLGGETSRARNASSGSTGGDEPGDSSVECPRCGAANADVGTVTYCRDCLERVR